MKTPILVLFLLSFTKNITAQTDSSGYFDVYRNETQQSLAPSLAGEMGRHIVRSDFRFLHRRTDGDYRPFQYWQAAYQTHWGNHGFGVISKNIPNSQLIALHTIGFQYAYGINMGKSTFWKNTKLNFGLELNITEHHASPENMVFLDQIDSNANVIIPSGEPPSDNKILHLGINAGVSLRSKKIYLLGTVVNITSPKNGLYMTTDSRQELRVDIQAGVKLFEWKNLSGWAVTEINTIPNNGKLGTSLSYKHFITTWKYKGNGGNIFQLSYFSPRLRMYAQYENIPTPFSYSTNSFLSTGIAIGITKK